MPYVIQHTGEVGCTREELLESYRKNKFHNPKQMVKETFRTASAEKGKYVGLGGMLVDDLQSAQVTELKSRRSRNRWEGAQWRLVPVQLVVVEESK